MNRSKTLGDPSLMMRHRCEGCETIFDCQPCSHYPKNLHTEKVPRFCVTCCKAKELVA